MKKVFTLLLLLILTCTFSIPTLAVDEHQKEKLIVVFKDEIDLDLLTDLDVDVIKTFDTLATATVEMPTAAIGFLEEHEDILAVEVDHLVSINSQTIDWGQKKINAPLAWQSNFTGKGVKIAVLDTGIAPHKDLAVAGGVSFTTYTKSFHDDNGHGTHVAGIIGAQKNGIGVVGVAPDSQLYAVKVLNEKGLGHVSEIVSGIEWSITNNMDIINLSLSTTHDSLVLRNVVNKAYQNGILVVASAGNHGTGSGDTVEFPAKYDAAIAVSAIDSNNKRGSFSATGPSVEITAPGVGILSTHLNDQYLRLNGTSMASAFVSGTLALLKEAEPNRTHVHYRTMLQNTVIDLGPKGRDEIFGFGLVQAPFVTSDDKEEVELVLQQGDRRPEVIQLKLDLERAGFKVSDNPNEIFGPATRVKVEEFQRAMGIAVNGIVDAVTFEKLDQIDLYILKQGDRRPEVIQLKLDLEKAGFLVSTNPNESYGPITAEMVRKFQDFHGLNVTGIANIATLYKLKTIVANLPEAKLPDQSVTYQQGDRDPGVIQLKLDLEKVGFQVSTNPNEVYGPLTAQRVREFQAYIGLPADGVAGPSTLKKLQEVIVEYLQEGDRSPAVVQLKLKLEAAGFQVSNNPNENYGPLTVRRVREFQAHYGLPVTGNATILTQQKLSEVTTTSLKSGDRHADVIILKLDLEKAGFRVSSNPNEIYGPLTTIKVREFQASVGLTASGIADPLTRRTLIETIFSG